MFGLISPTRNSEFTKINVATIQGDSAEIVPALNSRTRNKRKPTDDQSATHSATLCPRSCGFRTRQGDNHEASVLHPCSGVAYERLRGSVTLH
jgi:hypothetical protein